MRSWEKTSQKQLIKLHLQQAPRHQDQSTNITTETLWNHPNKHQLRAETKLRSLCWNSRQGCGPREWQSVLVHLPISKQSKSYQNSPPQEQGGDIQKPALTCSWATHLLKWLPCLCGWADRIPFNLPWFQQGFQHTPTSNTQSVLVATLRRHRLIG